MLADSREIEEALSFFSRHLGRELIISISIFDGLAQRERYKVAEVGNKGSHRHRVQLVSLNSQREIEIDLDHYSLATVTRDQKAVEITRLLGSSVSVRITASEISHRK
jgi:O-phosphoseryl-tRNA(Cys) synthetase